MATFPEWAGMPALILITALGLYVMVWLIRRQRSRADGAYLLAQAELPLDQQQHAGYSKSYASPDRRFVAMTGAHEVRMSVWLDELYLCDVQRNQFILQVPHPYSVNDVAWGVDNRLRFSVNRYPDGGTWIDVVLDPDARMAEVGGTVTPASVPFARLVAWLNRFHKGAAGRFFASDGPGTLALPGARSSRTFTLSIVLLVAAAVMTSYLDGRRRGDRLNERTETPTPTGPVATVTTSTVPVRDIATVAPPRPPSRSDPVRVGGNIKPPTKVRDVRPAYPPSARQARVQGVVILEVTIAADGSVIDARTIRSIPLLDAAAVDAVRQWQFTPTLLNGVPIPVRHTVTVQFTLP